MDCPTNLYGLSLPHLCARIRDAACNEFDKPRTLSKERKKRIKLTRGESARTCTTHRDAIYIYIRVFTNLNFFFLFRHSERTFAFFFPSCLVVVFEFFSLFSFRFCQFFRRLLPRVKYTHTHALCLFFLSLSFFLGSSNVCRSVDRYLGRGFWQYGPHPLRPPFCTTHTPRWNATWRHIPRNFKQNSILGRFHAGISLSKSTFLCHQKD